MTTVQDGGKVVSLRHRPPLLPVNAGGTHICQRLSRPQGQSAIEGIMSMKNSNDTHLESNPRTSDFYHSTFTTVPPRFPLYWSWNKEVCTGHKNNSKFGDCENHHNEAPYMTLWGAGGCGADKKSSTFYEVRNTFTLYTHKRPLLGCAFSQIISARTRRTCLRHLMILSSYL
jgi:hypothetical protein